jgi:hypothetical protein
LLYFLLVNLDNLRKGLVHEVAPILVLVQLCPKVSGHHLLLFPWQERVICGAKQNNPVHISLGQIILPGVRKISTGSFCGIFKICTTQIVLFSMP